MPQCDVIYTHVLHHFSDSYQRYFSQQEMLPIKRENNSSKTISVKTFLSVPLFFRGELTISKKYHILLFSEQSLMWSGSSAGFVFCSFRQFTMHLQPNIACKRLYWCKHCSLLELKASGRLAYYREPLQQKVMSYTGTLKCKTKQEIRNQHNISEKKTIVTTQQKEKS